MQTGGHAGFSSITPHHDVILRGAVHRVSHSAKCDRVIGIPLIVNLFGISWLTLGASFLSNCANSDDIEMVDVCRPIMALAILLLIFQIVLRPGIGF